jgi:hypothetical protein
VLRPYRSYLIRRWREGITDSMRLWREIQALGYTHSARTVCRFITQLRRAADAGLPPESQGSQYTRPQGSSPRAVSFAIVYSAAKRSDDAQTYLNQLCQVDALIARAYALSQAVLALMRERRGDDLEGSRWANDRVRRAAVHAASMIIQVGPEETVEALVTRCVQCLWPR